MDDAERLAVQKEILAADGDPKKLAAIAERHGVNADLWKFQAAVNDFTDTITEAARPLFDAVFRAANKLNRK